MNLPLMGHSPLPLIALLTMYAAMVKVGPKLMRNRKPFELKRVMIFYNFTQIILNLLLAVSVSLSLISLRKVWSTNHNFYNIWTVNICQILEAFIQLWMSTCWLFKQWVRPARSYLHIWIFDTQTSGLVRHFVHHSEEKRLTALIPSHVSSLDSVCCHVLCM